MDKGFFIPKKVIDELKRDPDMEIIIRAKPKPEPEEKDELESQSDNEYPRLLP